MEKYILVSLYAIIAEASLEVIIQSLQAHIYTHKGQDMKGTK